MAKAPKWIVIPLAALGCGGPGFQPLTIADDAPLSGRVIDQQGAAAAEVRVFLVEDGRSILSTVTGADGYFELPEAPIGSFELVANGGSRGGALREVMIYAHGDNSTGELMLAPYRNFPQLITYREIGFEERVTSAPGDLVGPIDALKVMGREPPPGHLYFYRDTPGERAIVDIELSSGEERVEHIFPRERDLQLLGGFALFEFPITGSNYAVTNLETNEQLASGRRGILGPPMLWRHDDGGVLIREVGDEYSTGHYDERIARYTREGMEVSDGLFMFGDAHQGIDPITTIGDELYYAPRFDCNFRPCRERQIRSINLRTLEIRTVIRTVSINSEFGVVAGASSFAVPREPEEGSFVVTLFQLDGSAADLWSGSAYFVDVLAAGESSALFMICDPGNMNPPCSLNYVRAGEPAIELGRAIRYRGGQTKNDTVLITEDGDEPGTALWKVDLSDGSGLRWSFDDASAELGRPLCGEAANYCGAHFDGEYIVVWDRLESASDIDTAIADLLPDGTMKARNFRTSVNVPLEPFVRRRDLGVEVIYALDPQGLYQLYLGPPGAPLDTFTEVTQLGSNLRTLVAISPDGKSIDYLADDPLTGAQQLFHRELEGRIQ